jgi:hypothetical protein
MRIARSVCTCRLERIYVRNIKGLMLIIEGDKVQPSIAFPRLAAKL